MDTSVEQNNIIHKTTIKRATGALGKKGEMSEEELNDLFSQFTNNEEALTTLIEYYDVHSFELGFEIFEMVIDALLEESSTFINGIIALLNNIINKQTVTYVFQEKLPAILEKYPQPSAQEIILSISHYIYEQPININYEALEYVIDVIFKIEKNDGNPNLIIDLCLNMMEQDHLVNQLLEDKFAEILDEYPQPAAIELANAIIIRNKQAAIYFQQNGYLDKIPDIAANGSFDQKKFIFEPFKAYVAIWRYWHRRMENVKQSNIEINEEIQMLSTVCDGVLRTYQNAINVMFEEPNSKIFKFYLEDINKIAQFPEFALPFLQHRLLNERFSDPDFAQENAVEFFNFLHSALDRREDNIWWESGITFPTDITANALRGGKWLPVFNIVAQFIEDEKLRFDSIIGIKSLAFEGAFVHHIIETGIIENIIDGCSDNYRFSDRTTAVECLCDLFSITDKEDAYILINMGIMDIVEENIDAMCKHIMDSFMNMFTQITRLAEVDGCDDLIPLIFDNDVILDFLHKANDEEFDVSGYDHNEGMLPSEQASNILCRDPAGFDDHFD